MKTTRIHIKKLDDRSKSVVYLGKEPGTKAFHLYDPREGTVHVSRDVIFEEKKTWPWDKEEISTTLVENGSRMYKVFDVETNVQDKSTSDQSPVQSPQSGMSSPGGSNEEGGYRSDVSSHSSSEPLRYMRLSDVYNEMEDLQAAEEELMLVEIDEPTTYDQENKEKVWREAMQTEIEAIERNNTWKLTDLPPNHKAIDLKWVFKEKKNTNGKIVKHKARLVAKGYVQKFGVDFLEVFAPVTRMEMVRLLLALAAYNEWQVHHIDVKSAFLNGELLEEVYVTQPRGFEKEGEEHKVYKLSKALYGLRQAPRAWYARLSIYLVKLGFTKCPFEHAVYMKHENNEVLIVGVYVDDLLITGTNLNDIVEFKQQIQREFEMSDMGQLAYYIGMEVEQEKGYIEIKQTAYAKRILERADMAECKPVSYPMEPKIQLHKDENGKLVNPT